MADVFVSYARGDQPLAEHIVQRLTDSGFTVWWDSELLPHNRFANVIEKEIGAARAVLVIWSATAIQSQWVRAEAELAREQQKLIQAAGDRSPIPLPFNQFQVADLSRWRGAADDPQWSKVLASVAHFASAAGGEAGHPAASREPSSAKSRRPFIRSRRLLVLGAAGLFLMASGAALVSTLARPAPRGQRIAIQPFRTIGATPAVQDFAAELSDGLQNALTRDQLQTVSPADIETLRGAELLRQLKTLGVGLMFSGAVQAKGPAVTVSMRLDDPVQHATLWTAELSGASAQFDQLQARVSALTVAVLDCSAQGLAPGANLADGALQAFLHACELSETSDHGLSGARSAYAMLEAMRQATRAAPNFAAAHSVLAKHLAFLMTLMPPDQRASLRNEAEREAHRALALDAKDPDGFVALALLAPPLDFAGREALLRKALAANPAWPHANGFLGNVMTDVGCLQEALTLYQRAASVNPQSVDWAQEAAGGLIRVGQTGEADRELARFAQLWPNNPENLLLRFYSLTAQKRWPDALKLVDQVGDASPLVSRTWSADWRRTLSALASGGVAQRDALRRSLVASSGANPEGAITRLALLGFVNDAFGVAQTALHVDPGDADASSFLFNAETAALRRDPRFIALAARYGLVDYWRRSGRWADFCREADLPYSCSAEAAKLSPRGHA